jgi:hypothetical protein
MTGPGLAWVEGRPTRPGDAAMCMPAPTAFHRAAAIWTYHRFRARAIRRSAGRAEGVGPSTGPVSPTARRGPRRVLWPAPPSPRSLARAINSSRNLNGGNVLVDPGKPPELLDVVPLCRAAGYAHARFALWVAPRRGHDSVLRAAKRVWRGTNCSSSSDADDADRSGTRRRGEHDHRVSRRPSEGSLRRTVTPAQRVRLSVCRSICQSISGPCGVPDMSAPGHSGALFHVEQGSAGQPSGAIATAVSPRRSSPAIAATSS